MSLQKSKGLSNRVVQYVVGRVDEIVPTLPPLDRGADAQIGTRVENRQRLIYGAITRASTQLVWSYLSKMEPGLAMSRRVQAVGSMIWRVGYVKVAPTNSGRYLRELGAEAPGPIAARGGTSRSLSTHDLWHS